VRIYDLNSTNGTRINGEAVHISDLQPGDEIRLGSQVLLLSVNGSTGPSAHQERW
jgi:pSer/pThr/pTyr-binding forkhead associated (FHA) protein